MDYSDQAKEIRNGEEIDSDRVEAFLRDFIAGLQGPMTIQQFLSGHSNLTYLITCGDREMSANTEGNVDTLILQK